MQNTDGIFEYTNSYFKNGNVKTQNIDGSYKENFGYSDALNFSYTYDKSNRLLLSSITGGKSFELENSYDKSAFGGGNILTLKRHNNQGSLIDNFSYNYYSGTNKLQKITGTVTQYTYDSNGNMISDKLNKNESIQYDHRNLITELQNTSYILNDSLIILTKYYYDEAGNRIRKMSYNTLKDSLVNDEIYSRDISGRELAIYKNNFILEYPTYGLDMTGKIKDEALYFYMKDHLGSVRAVIEDYKIVSSQDYDACGYILQDRTYDSDDSKFKFTGKERDEESKYDYFGARYYDSRIGRWGSEDPLGWKYASQNPYNYVFNNPLLLKDRDGRDVIVEVDGTNIKVTIKFYYTTKGVKGLSDDKIGLLKSYLREAKKNWNKAGKNFEFEGIDYNVTFDISSEEVKTSEKLEELKKSKDGSNVVESIEEEMWAGVNTNVLFLGNSERLVEKQYTGSHEMGHIMGIPHPAAYNDEIIGPMLIDVMSYGENREPPRAINTRQLIDKIDLSDKSKQIIRGTQ